MAISALPVLTYPKVRSAPVLEIIQFRHGLPAFGLGRKALAVRL
jgi:hypothetical protein